MADDTKTQTLPKNTFDLNEEFEKLYKLDDDCLTSIIFLDFALIELTRKKVEEKISNVFVGSDDPIIYTLGAPLRPDELYRHIRKVVTQTTSDAISNTFKNRLPNQGIDFCKGVKYCKAKGNISDLNTSVKQFLKDVSEFGKVGESVWLRFKNKSEDGAENTDPETGLDASGGADEATDSVVDIGIDIIEIGVDAAIPLSWFARISKGTLDGLCECCTKCSGKGKIGTGKDKKKCQHCNGEGHLL